MTVPLCFFIFHFALSVSAAEALTREVAALNEPRHPSKRDYYDSIDKGRDLLCFLESPSLARQSIYTTTDALERSGWERHYIQADENDLVLPAFQPALDRLGLPYVPDDTVQISWRHERESRTTTGQTAPVCVVGSLRDHTY